MANSLGVKIAIARNQITLTADVKDGQKLRENAEKMEKSGKKEKMEKTKIDGGESFKYSSDEEKASGDKCGKTCDSDFSERFLKVVEFLRKSIVILLLSILAV